MSFVWKFPLAIEDQQLVEMPKGAELLHVGEQHGTLALWALVNPTGGQKLVRRRIFVRCTGHRLWTHPYVGTVVMAGGDLVWHVFDGGEE